MLLRGSAAWEAGRRMANPPEVQLGYVCVTGEQASLGRPWKL